MKNKFINKIVIFSTSLFVLSAVFIANSKTVNINAGTQNIIFNRVLNIKSTGDDVKVLQNLLLDLKLDIGSKKSTRIFDNYTLTAIKAIQRYSKINIDGSFGNSTFNEINKLLKKSDSKTLNTLKTYQEEYLNMDKNGVNTDKVYPIDQNCIIFKGTNNTILGLRNNSTPQVIINFISQEKDFKTLNGEYNDINNSQNSCHFILDTDGTIYQYIDLKYTAKSSNLYYFDKNLVKSKSINNSDQLEKYAIQIMNISYDGSLTANQLKSSIWLHNYITDFVRTNFNYDIPIERTNILNLSDIDPINFLRNTEDKFPWFDLINGLKVNKSL